MTIALLCIVACARVFVYSAAFPFFNNVDEQAHFDLVCKYSHGHVPIPGHLENFSRESAELIALHQSPEYLLSSKDGAAPSTPPPLWTLPSAERSARLAAGVAGLARDWAFRPDHCCTGSAS